MRTATIVVVAIGLAGCSMHPIKNSDSLQRASQTRGEQLETKTAAKVASAERGSPLLPDGPTGEDFPHLRNLRQLTDRIYTGGEPEDEQSFEELVKLGVHTVVSVDGARPKVELAEKHGLRYVHIPIGYDGVPVKAGKQLASLVKNTDGPFYIHCHHGTHRGPAAAAVACIADGAADGKAALAVLEKAGTGKNYSGLWRDVQAYKPPLEGEELPELMPVAEVGSLAAAMAQIDRASDNLKLCEAAAWKTPTDHPDIAPPQQALLLREGFHETVRRLVESNDYDEQFLMWIKEAEGIATTLEGALNASDAEAAGSALSKIQEKCQQCHGKYRN